MVHEGLDLTPSMFVVDVAIGLGFRYEELEGGGVAPGYDVGTVASDERGHRIAGSVEEVRCNVHHRMALLYGLRGSLD